MTIYKEKIVDALTGKETFRDYTEAEIAEVNAEVAKKSAQAQAEQEAEAAKAAARQAILDRLGLTADEAALLLGAN
jgi:hypothetical protein